MLGGLFYPTGTKDNPIDFESLCIPYIYKEIYFEGVYNDIFQPQLDNVKDDKIVIDVGANIGIVTDYMRRHSKKVYSIEPSSENFEALKKNKEFNSWDNVQIFNLALADKDGELELSKNLGNRTMNSLVIGDKTPDGRYRVKGTKYVMNTGSPYGEREIVKTLRFDTFMKQNQIDRVDFVKFDVEGAEDMILRSEGFTSIADKIQAIEVEMHYPSWPLLVKHMEDLGFKVRRYESSAVIVLFYR